MPDLTYYDDAPVFKHGDFYYFLDENACSVGVQGGFKTAEDARNAFLKYVKDLKNEG